MANDQTKLNDDTVLGELQSIKRLLMLALTKSGVTQAELATALGVSQPTIHRMLPTASLRNKKVSRRNKS